MTQLIKTDKAYASWIEELSQRYRKSQIKAATHVNSEMLDSTGRWERTLLHFMQKADGVTSSLPV